MAELDANDKALIAYFLRGMRRFRRHVQEEDIFERATDEVSAKRIDAAYLLACMQLKKGQENQ